MSKEQSGEREPMQGQSAVGATRQFGEADITGEVIKSETLEEIKDLMAQAPRLAYNGPDGHTLYHFDPELNIGISAGYKSGPKEHLHIGVYTPSIINYLNPRYNISWDYLKENEPELLEALKREQRLYTKHDWQQIKDDFIGALSVMGVEEIDELSDQLQYTIEPKLDLQPGQGLSSESDLNGFGWVLKGAKVETVESVGGAVRVGRSDWPGTYRSDTTGIPTEQTGQVLKRLLAQGLVAYE